MIGHIIFYKYCTNHLCLIEYLNEEQITSSTHFIDYRKKYKNKRQKLVKKHTTVYKYTYRIMSKFILEPNL